MKVIFLDIDGVLNLIPQGHDQYGGIFHPHFIENLKHIIDETDAQIVISSSWRYSGLDVMKRMWKHRNLPGNVIDITPIHREHVIRGIEIKEWLYKHQDIESYVIFDDDKDMLEEQMENFVNTFENFTHTDYIDCGYGLTIECAEEAIKILNKK